MLLLTTTGRKSGQLRTCPVVYLEDEGRFVVINTNAGNAKTPAWSLNLKANPDAEVEIGTRKQPVRARIAEGEERADLWRKHNVQYSGFDEYAEKLDRDIAVFVLDPRRLAGGLPRETLRGGGVCDLVTSRSRAASGPRAGAAVFSACCSRSGAPARG